MTFWPIYCNSESTILFCLYFLCKNFGSLCWKFCLQLQINEKGSWLYSSRSTDQLGTRKSCGDFVFWKTKKMASYAQENTDNSVFIVNTEQVESYTVSKKYGKVCSSMSMNHNKKSLNHLWLNTLEQGKTGVWLHSCYSLALLKQGWERLNIWSRVMLLSCRRQIFL